MKRSLLLLAAVLLIGLAHGQTFFYIGEIAVVPDSPTEEDDVSIQLIGNLSSTGS